MRKLGPLLAAIIIVLIVYAFISVTASAPLSIGQPGRSSGGSGLPGATNQPKMEIKPSGCVWPAKLTTDGASHGPDVSENYAVYEYTASMGQNCTCVFRANIAPGSCSKGCAYYGKASERCNVDSDCKGAELDKSEDIFAYDMKSKFEFPIAQTAANEVNPSVYGNKVVYFVEGSKSDTNSYDPKTGVTTIRTKYTPGKIMLYDISTKQSTLVASTNTITGVRPRIYDDTIVWMDGEKLRMRGNFVVNKSNLIDVDVTAVGNQELWSYNIPLKRTTKIVAVPWTVGMWGGSIGDGNIAILTSLSEQPLIMKDSNQEYTNIGDYTITITDNGVVVCDKDYRCSQAAGVDFPTAFGPEDLANPDIYEEKVVYQTDISQGIRYWKIMLYDRSTEQSRPLLPTKANEMWPKVFRTRVIWEEQGWGNLLNSLVMYDIEKNEMLKMDTTVRTDGSHDIYGANVVWSGILQGGLNIFPVGEWDIIRNRTNDPKNFRENVTGQGGHDIAPATYGPIIAWENSGNIYKYQCPEDIVPALPKCAYKTQGVGFNQMVYPTLKFSGQTADSVTYTALMSSECLGRLVQLKKDSCKGTVVAECTVGPFLKQQCTGSFKPPTASGTYKYVLCDPRDGQASTIASLKVA